MFSIINFEGEILSLLKQDKEDEGRYMREKYMFLIKLILRQRKERKSVQR